jgi:Peptidase family M48
MTTSGIILCEVVICPTRMSERPMRPALVCRRVFGLAAAYGAAGVLAATAAVGLAIASVHQSADGSDYLTILGVRLSYPTGNAAEALLLALAALGAVAIALAVRGTWRQRSAYRAFVNDLPVVGQLRDHPAVTVIAGTQPQAFCAGYIRPSVYVSEGALELLTDEELEAVLAHEYHHQRVRDPLRFAGGQILSRALFYVPALRPMCDRYANLAELSADQAAVAASAGEKAPLASALLVFDQAAPGEAGAVAAARVDSLLGEPPPESVPWRLVIASTGALAGLGALIWRISEVASARASFNLPVLSSRPCIAIMSSIVLLLGTKLVAHRRAQLLRTSR